jgi:hypothetical protein
MENLSQKVNIYHSDLFHKNREKWRARVRDDACEKIETIRSSTFLSGLKELIPP